MVTAGRFLSFCVLFAINLILAKCEIEVKILNQLGELVNEVAMGVPFQLHIIAKGDCDVSEVEFSEAFDICKISSLGTVKSVTNINHVLTHAITHRYLMRIDQEGSYVFGPIWLKHANNLIGKTDLAVKVRPDLASKNSSINLTAELKINKSKVYVDEKIELKIRFYFNDQSISNVTLNLPTEFKDKFDFKFIDQAISGNIQQNGAKLQYLEWNLVAFAKQPGDQILPAFGIVFEKNQRVNQFFIFQNHDKKEIFSNALKLQVKSVPKINPMHEFAKILPEQVVVGVFDSFTAKVDQNLLKDGQAAQLIVQLEGEANWEKVKISLSGIPQNLQSYAGVVKQQSNIKSFEYILQGLKPGACKLPEQFFCYFDPLAEKYKVLKTNPIELNVSNVPAVTNHVAKSKLAKIPEPQSHVLDQQIKPIIETESNDSQKFYLPAWLFSILLLLPILILFIKDIFVRYDHKSRHSFKIFKKELVVLEKNQQVNVLYSFFTKILIQKFHLQITQINLKTIDNLLITYGMLSEQSSAFCKFYNELAAAAFSNDYKSDNLFEEAHNWLMFLERISN